MDHLVAVYGREEVPVGFFAMFITMIINGNRVTNVNHDGVDY